MKKIKKDSFWSPEGIKTLILLIEKLAFLMAKIIEFVFLFPEKTTFSCSFPLQA